MKAALQEMIREDLLRCREACEEDPAEEQEGEDAPEDNDEVARKELKLPGEAQLPR